MLALYFYAFHCFNYLICMKDLDDFKAYEGINPLPKYLNNKRLKYVVKFAGEVESVLDAGCGDGYVLTKINAKKLTGIDLVEAKLLRASQKRKGINFVVGNIEKMPFNDSLFDAVLCNEVLEHVRDYKVVIDELVRVCKNNGHIIVSIPNLTNMKVGRLFSLRFPVNPTDHINYITPQMLYSSMLNNSSKSNVILIEETYLPFSWLPFHFCINYVAKYKVIKGLKTKTIES